MKRIVLTMGVALGLTAGAVQAAPITGGETDVTVTADLAALGLGAAPFGTATADGATFTFPITGGNSAEDGALTILHDGSGVTLSTLDAADETEATVGNFVIDTAAETVFGDVIGGPGGLEFFTFGEAEGGIGLDIAAPLAGALTSVFGAADLTGVPFGVATTAPEFDTGESPAPVPLPASALLLVAALGGLGALGRRRRAA